MVARQPTVAAVERPADSSSQPQRSATVALGVALALVLGPKALGLLVQVCELALRRFSAWWPPTGLELMPLGVAGLVMLAAAYALATHGSRRRRTGSPKRRRFLPAMDLLLLQLGNVTFLAFALILALVTLGLLASALRSLTGQPWLVANSLSASLTLAAVAALLSLRRGPPTGSRRVLRRRWRRRAAILGGAVGALWLIGGSWLPGLCDIQFRGIGLDPPVLVGLYVLLWALLAASAAVGSFAGSRAGSGESAPPRRGPAATSFLAWLAYLGFLALYLNGAFLILGTHLAAK